MKIINSLISAFQMYSRIPMPQTEWKEENRRYALCFFPFVGAVCGILLIVWRLICTRFNITGLLFAAVSAAIPIFVTGGIHLDGFCDMTDALSSFASREKKLEIMSDPHIGSFAAIHLILYLLLQTVLFAQVSDFKSIAIIALGYVLSRSLSALAAVTLKAAKKDGTLNSFTQAAQKKLTFMFLFEMIAITAAAMIILQPLTGLLAVSAAAAAFFYYRYKAYKSFGGITGDTEGWFLQICEMAILIFSFVGELVSEAVL